MGESLKVDVHTIKEDNNGRDFVRIERESSLDYAYKWIYKNM